MIERSGKLEHYFTALPKSKTELGVIHTNLQGKPFTFLTDSSVFSKKRIDSGTRLLIESMILPKQKGNVLDVGCGYGAIGIAAATFNPRLHVVLTDVNSRAIHLAKQNIERNLATNAETRCGTLYETVKELAFDCILSNPPVSAGMETVRTIVSEAPKVMTGKATFQMVIRWKKGGKTLQGFFEEVFGNSEVLARESGYRVLLAENH